MTPPFKPIPDRLDYPAGSAGALAQVAATQIGYREGINNDTAFGVWYGMNHVPWCAEFVSWAAARAGVGTDVIPKHAYTPAGAAWFKARGRLVSTPQAGDVGYVYYDSIGRIGHVFIVERLFTTEGGAVLMNTIEGNTNDTGSSQGNGVYRLVRADTTNLSYGRPAYAEGLGGEGGGEPIGEEDMSQQDVDEIKANLGITRGKVEATYNQAVAALAAATDAAKPYVIVHADGESAQYLVRDGGLQHLELAVFDDLRGRGLARLETVSAETLAALLNPVLAGA